MLTRASRLFLSLALLLALFAGTTSPARAGQPEMLLFPWVANGVTIDDPRGFGSLGPFYSSITISNPTTGELVVQYVVLADSYPDTPGSFLLPAFASRTLTPEQLGVPVGTGRGMAFHAQYSGGGFSAPISGVLKQSSPVPQNDASQTGGSHTVVGGYTGLPWSEEGNHVVLPIAQTNSNWNTRIHVSHSDGLPDDVTIQLTLQESGGGETLGPFVEETAAGATVTFDLLDLGVPEEWVGSAVINADSGVTAVAERVKNETSMLVMNTSRLVPGPGTEQSAPLIFRDWFHWNTGISVANLAGVDNDIFVRYYDDEGIEVKTDMLTIPAGGMDFLHFPAEDGDEAFLGSAMMEASQPFVGAVDEVKYLGEDGDTGHAMSYMIEPYVAEVGSRLALALYQRGDLNTSGGDTSGVQLFNPTHLPVQYSYGIFDQEGNSMTGAFEEFPVLSPKEHVTIYSFDVGALPDGFTGSMLVFIHSGGGLTGVSNNVNYDVEFDGSASFNLVQVTGLE